MLSPSSGGAYTVKLAPSSSFEEGNVLRPRLFLQVLILVAIVIVLALAVLDVVDNWSDWLVLGVIIGTVIAVAFTVMNRQYPTRKRAMRRDSDSSRW
jgi:uncharacterized membrane protein